MQICRGPKSTYLRIFSFEGEGSGMQFFLQTYAVSPFSLGHHTKPKFANSTAHGINTQDAHERKHTADFEWQLSSDVPQVNLYSETLF